MDSRSCLLKLAFLKESGAANSQESQLQPVANVESEAALGPCTKSFWYRETSRLVRTETVRSAEKHGCARL